MDTVQSDFMGKDVPYFEDRVDDYYVIKANSCDFD